MKFNAVQLSQLPDDPRVVLDPNTDCSSAAPSPAEPRESKPGPHHGELGKASARLGNHRSA